MVFFMLAGLSSLSMGLFYVMDMFFESKEVYKRPSQAMIVSSIVPLLSVPFFLATPWWHSTSLFVWFMAFFSGILLIWANWFYFLVMFPVDKKNREAQAVEGATELALYEGTTPAIVLILSLIASQFIVYSDAISIWQGLAIIWTVTGLVLYATSGGYIGFTRWSYRLKLIAFALLVSLSQLIQDIMVGYVQNHFGLSVVDAYFSVAPWVWVGMFSGILIIFWKKEWSYFKIQWKEKIRKYSTLVLFAELVALSSYAALIGSYTGEHVAVAGAVAASFPVVVFLGGLVLQKTGVQTGLELVDLSNIAKQFLFIIFTLIGVIGVIML